MDYLFDGVLLYHSGEGVIVPLGGSDEDSIILTPVLNRILSLLVENQGQLVTRDDFLEKVWDNYGRATSSNTLTQYISILRKLFIDQLNKECVITVPKQGYMLSQDIVIEKLAPLTPTLTKASHAPTEEVVDNNANKLEKRASRWKLIVFYALAITLVLIFFPSSQSNNYPKDIKDLSSYYIDGCHFYFFDKKKPLKDTVSRIKNHMEQFNLNCSDGAEFYFFHSNPITPNNTYSMLARCFKNKDLHDECVTTIIIGE
ncbi:MULTISPECIES: winged helix-turn-helix domain-containing protein [unclassified Serratia (in: enterobacteria)]|uniref:winged helix-turn-helix domain-containing protein n=1 Tax=unclassified Serratia (in: enterobacteria) TaxID=2647522 RepID=UPI00068B8439|nr:MULTISPECIES: winged helix-turn-helix domain-containing protein [unclassified Serratia (in: enterobacteria)]